MTELFSILEPYNISKDISARISKEIPEGYAAGKSTDLSILAQCVYMAGGGNYLEIGTLFGGSAILVALIMDYYGLEGKVVCVDPLDGYYGKGNKVKGLIPTKEKVIKNAKYFGVKNRLEIIEKPSIPFPSELKNRTFSVTYIDGDHWGNAPEKDWLSVKDRTINYIIFDNYDFEHPSVIKAAVKASRDPSWTPVHIDGITFVLQRNVNFIDPHSWAGGNYE